MCRLFILVAATFAGLARAEAPCTLALSLEKATYDPTESIPLSLTLANTGDNALDLVVIDTTLHTWGLDVVRSDGSKAALTAFGGIATAKPPAVSSGIERPPPGAVLRVEPGKKLTIVLRSVNRIYDTTDGDVYTIRVTADVYERVRPRGIKHWALVSNPVRVTVRNNGLWTGAAEERIREVEGARGR